MAINFIENSTTPVTASVASGVWLVREGATLATAPEPGPAYRGAIDASAKANSRVFIVEGNVFADWGPGIYLGEGLDTKIVVGDTGSITSSTTGIIAWAPKLEATVRMQNDGEIYGSSEGIYVVLTQFDLTNNGTIGGAYTAVVARSDVTHIVNNGIMNGRVAAYGDAAGKAAIHNSGTINGRLEVLTNAAQVNTIFNSGTIAAHDKLEGSQNAVIGGLATEQVVNTGTIRGHMDLGAGADTFSNSGFVKGNVSFQAGDDALTLNSGGVIDGNVDMGDGDDRINLIGGSITGTVSGGQGNDYYVIRNADAILAEAVDQGIDTVETRTTWYLDDNFENLVLAGNANVEGHGNELANALTGNIASNRLFGYEGDDVLDGGKGADRLDGGAGNDTYIVDNAADVVIESAGAGRDTVKSTVSLVLSANVEDLVLGGASALNGTGNALANTLAGNAGKNVLNGGTGKDTLIGGAGDDTYITDGGDTIKEDANGGIDLVKSSVTLTLGANLENLTLTGTSNISGTGNALDNVLVGNAGKSVLNGGPGADTLTGGRGSDTYVFNTALGGKNIDKISDFDTKADIIHLDDAIFRGLKIGALSADAFRIGTAAADASDRILYNDATGALFFDRDGSGSAYKAVQFAILSSGLKNAGIAYSDFFVI